MPAQYDNIFTDGTASAYSTMHIAPFDQQMNAHFNTIIASCNKLEHTLECTTCIERICLEIVILHQPIK